MTMIPHGMIGLQLAAIGRKQVRAIVKRQRLKWGTQQIADILEVFVQAQERHTTLLCVWRENQSKLGIGYTGLAKAVVVLAPLLNCMAVSWRATAGLGFDSSTIIDSALLGSKKPGCIRAQDWARGRVTVRRKQTVDGKTQVLRYCGQKAFCVMNSQRLILRASIEPVNTSDANWLKWPQSMYRQGLKTGNLLIDRGFDNRAVRDSVKQLNTLHHADVRVVAPPRKNSTRPWPATMRHVYRRRWHIETFFQQVKDTRGRYRLDLAGARHLAIHKAKLALTVWAWNLQRWTTVQKNSLRQQQRQRRRLVALAA